MRMIRRRLRYAQCAAQAARRDVARREAQPRGMARNGTGRALERSARAGDARDGVGRVRPRRCPRRRWLRRRPRLAVGGQLRRRRLRRGQHFSSRRFVVLVGGSASSAAASAGSRGAFRAALMSTSLPDLSVTLTRSAMRFMALPRSTSPAAKLSWPLVGELLGQPLGRHAHLLGLPGHVRRELGLVDAEFLGAGQLVEDQADLDRTAGPLRRCPPRTAPASGSSSPGSRPGSRRPGSSCCRTDSRLCLASSAPRSPAAGCRPCRAARPGRGRAPASTCCMALSAPAGPGCRRAARRACRTRWPAGRSRRRGRALP